MEIFKEDFEATGKCNMEMEKDFMELQISWAMQKESMHGSIKQKVYHFKNGYHLKCNGDG